MTSIDSFCLAFFFLAGKILIKGLNREMPINVALSQVFYVLPAGDKGQKPGVKRFTVV